MVEYILLFFVCLIHFYNLDACGSHAKCTNTIGSFTCTCAEGYTSDISVSSQFACTDVNECETGKAKCDLGQTCVNLQGGFTCGCENGFKWDSTSNICVDVNECDTKVTCSENELCHNYYGGYR